MWDPRRWPLGLPGTLAAAMGASMLVDPVETAVLVEPDLAPPSMVRLHTRGSATSRVRWHTLLIGLVQPGQFSAMVLVRLRRWFAR